jgi:hypothetical protein
MTINPYIDLRITSPAHPSTDLPDPVAEHQARHHHPIAGDQVVTPDGLTGVMRGQVYALATGAFTWLYATLELDPPHAHLTPTGLIRVSYLDLKLAA